MGTFLPTLVSSPSTEKAFLTEVYNYMMSLYTGITCDVIDSDGVTVLGHDVNSFVWVAGQECNIDFNLGNQYKLRFQASPVNAQSYIRSSGYNVRLLHGTDTIMSKGSGSTRYATSGCVSFGKQDSNGDVVAFEYPNNPRRLLFTTYIAEDIFILWITPYTGDSFASSDSISLMKFKDSNNNWHWASHASPNSIENGSIYDADGLNPTTKTSIFSYATKLGYMDYISQSNFAVGDIKSFSALNIFDCTTVNIGDTFLLDDNHSYLAIGTHSLVPIDYDITPSLIEKTITENGTYSAKDDGADGYSEVTVDTKEYLDLTLFDLYFNRNTTTPTITHISPTEVSLSFQDQNAQHYELCSFGIPLEKGIYVAEIYATVDTNTGLSSSYAWGIYSSRTDDGAKWDSNDAYTYRVVGTYVAFNKDDTAEHYYEVPINMVWNGAGDSGYICFAMGADNNTNASVSVRSLKIRKV